MNDQATKIIVFVGGAALIYLFAKKMNVFGLGGTTGASAGGSGSGALISQVGGTTATGGTMGGTTAATGVTAAATTAGGLNTETAQDIYSTKPMQI